VIAFDFKEALSFEGETGPYCQYAAVRANSIFRKLDETTRLKATELLGTSSTDSAVRERALSVLGDESGTEVWSMVMLAQRLDEVVNQCRASQEPANLAKYTFNLAKSFNLFYHRHRIIVEEDEMKKAVLIAAADIARRQLTAALATLGISVPERM
jgi:arginyl-tRNA synthetase